MRRMHSPPSSNRKANFVCLKRLWLAASLPRRSLTPVTQGPGAAGLANWHDSALVSDGVAVDGHWAKGSGGERGFGGGLIRGVHMRALSRRGNRCDTVELLCLSYWPTLAAAV